MKMIIKVEWRQGREKNARTPQCTVGREGGMEGGREPSEAGDEWVGNTIKKKRGRKGKERKKKSD